MVGAATVCVGWSAYLTSFLRSFGVDVDERWTSAPIMWDPATGEFSSTGAVLNLPAAAISLLMTLVLIRGVRESAWLNNTAVAIKLLVIVIFICAMVGGCVLETATDSAESPPMPNRGSQAFRARCCVAHCPTSSPTPQAPRVNTDNWVPFVPPNTGTFGVYGISGVLRGASVVFFAYIGFDSVSCCAQECRRPERDLPIGTLTSLVVCTGLYIAVALVATGLVPYQQFRGVANPISYAVAQTPGYGWLGAWVCKRPPYQASRWHMTQAPRAVDVHTVTTIDIGALAGLTSVILVSLLSQPRIFYSMAIDGFLPPFAAKVSSRDMVDCITL
jgi:APA family basic amino acid/polyamine antiporter